MQQVHKGKPKRIDISAQDTGGNGPFLLETTLENTYKFERQ